MSNYTKIGKAEGARTELHDKLGLTGAEISVNTLPAGASVPFVHAHKANEEIYFILSGKGKAVIDGQFIPIYGKRNSDRMENYHRLDVSYTFGSRPNNGKPYRWSLSAGLYNAYGRKNPWSVSFYQDPDNPTRSYAVKVYLFSVVPFVTFNFNF